MCGITGLFAPTGLDPRHAPSLVHAMTTALTHRGPDAGWTRQVSDNAVLLSVLGVRRLAVVDVAGGRQPACDTAQRWWVCLNGELYNHRRLRQELQAEGVAFRGEGEAELVAQLVAHLGVDLTLSRLDGQFALSIVDSHTRTLHLVRDRMGQKPLYWTTLADGTLAWGSELAALHPVASAWKLNPDALRALLLWEFIPSPLTPWRGVHKLEPGTVLVSRDGHTELRSYWSPPVPAAGRGGERSLWARSVRGSLQVSVLARLQADVPVGLLLSGGLDSSAVSALAQARSTTPVASFSVAVDAPGFDEGPQARRVAAHLGTAHRQIPLQQADLPRLLDEITHHMSEPLADSSLVPTWLLMAAVRQAGLKCVLSGDGADELFGGYPTLLAHRLAAAASGLSEVMGPLVRALPTSAEGVTADYMAKRFIDGLKRPFPWRHQTWMGAWLPEEIGPVDDLDSLLQRITAPSEGAPAGVRALHLDQRLYLADGVLVKVDRASMAHGVEVRSPFLAHRLVALAADIGLGHKVGTPRPGALFRGKVVLKQAVADLLPSETTARKKQGFGAPVGPWLRGPHAGLLDGIEDTLSDAISGDTLRRVRREHASGKVDHRRRLWSAVVLSRWRRSRWGDQ